MSPKPSAGGPSGARMAEVPHRGRAYRLPPHARGMRIGLFGGTFDPPHAAHLDACLLAMKRLRLDQVWWLVTPGNPLKDTRGLAPLEERIAAARRLARHPRIVVSGLEAGLGHRYTYDTIRYLVDHCPGVRFVWLMGADNLRSFHRWQRWRDIAALIPIAVIDRAGPSLYAAAGPAAQALSAARLPETAAVTLADRRPPAWVFLHGLKSALSSTALRAARRSHARRQTRRKRTGDAAGPTVRSKSAGKAGRTPPSKPSAGQPTASVRAGRKAAKRKTASAGRTVLAGSQAGSKRGSAAGAKSRMAGKKAGRKSKAGAVAAKKTRRPKSARARRQGG